MTKSLYSNRPPPRIPTASGFFQSDDGAWWYAERDKSRSNGFTCRHAEFTPCPSCGTTFLTTRKAIRRAGERVAGRLPRCAGCRPRFVPGYRRLDGRGYFSVKVSRDDPLIVMANRSGWCGEHRIVLARAIGRPLHRHETVHHLNGDRADNRIENLQLRSNAHGLGAAFRCADCGSDHIVAVGLGEHQESLL